MRAPVCVVFCAALMASPSLWAADKDDFNDYLVDIGAGHVSASDMLKVSGSAVTTIEAPKDFVAALNAFDSGDAKSGVGLAITPARTSLAPVSISNYVSSPMVRLWAGTTFSYAKNRNTLGGVDYKQDAAAVNVSYYLNAKDDPHVAGYLAFSGCEKRKELNKEVTDLVLAELAAAGADQAKREAVRLAAKARQPAYQTAVTAVSRDCARDAAGQKWNATQVAISYGQAWIRAPGASSSRLSLARTMALSGTYGPSTQTLLNVTLRRSDRELDLETIAASPAYRRSTIAAARLTYGHGEERDLYGLVEVSNAKSSTATLPNTSFKYALGVDKRVAEGVWLEFRVGRRQAVEAGATETVGLLNLKFSTTTTLPKAQAQVQ